MKNIFPLLAILSSFIFISFTTENDCTILKNNTFSYKTQGENVVVIFKGNKHIEYHNKRKNFIKSDIEWISDCEYYLIIRENTLPNFPFKMGTKMHIKINKVRGKKVYYTSTLGGRSWDGRLTKIKQAKYE
ncbi:hypothetical protein JL193_08365 [Polaribacter batillariae]|uniref:Uncharacterized protein n=1 Tax=Polaribacter batillariae TaxID=2808900 RepID=A0ABX7SS76_9FLAO|nr:hypothetical protein [Polaribacter batillariae]QTD36183.1 hypothetical protein JL193_08365 [Polaribacter batillariae]